MGRILKGCSHCVAHLNLYIYFHRCTHAVHDMLCLAVMEVSRPGLVSRPDFMGLGLVSQRSRSWGSKVSVSLETILSRPQDLKGENENKRHEKSTSVGGRFQYPQWKNDIFRLEKYFQWKKLCLGLGLVHFFMFRKKWILGPIHFIIMLH